MLPDPAPFTVPARKPLPPLECFPPQPMLLLVFMLVASMGLYAWWWLYSRSLLLNTLLPAGLGISRAFMHACLTGVLVTVALAFLSAANPGELALGATVDFLSLTLNLLSVYWVLLFRRGLHHLLEGTAAIYQLNVFWTVLLQVLYLQYKINLVCEHRQTGVM